MQPFKCETKTEGESLLVTYSGSIDETAKLIQFPTKGVGKYIFDLNDVRSINSMGIKGWLQLLQALPVTTPMVLRRVPHVMLSQTGLIKGFIPAYAVVESFYVSYYCENCDHSQSQLFVAGKEFSPTDGSSSIQWPEVKCEKKGCVLEPDIWGSKDQYFNFLNRLNGRPA